MIRDHIENFELSDEVLGQHLNEAQSLQYLIEGLDWLYRQIKDVERVVLSRIHPGVKLVAMGNDPFTAGLPKPLVTCSFHWYAVSACNFVRLLGWLHRKADSTAKSPLEYVRGVLPEVYPWRNKIAAHFARSSDSHQDSEAERLASVLAPVGFCNDAFYASSMTVHVRKGGVSSSSKSLRPWSLTKVHEALRARYWPPGAGA